MFASSFIERFQNLEEITECPSDNGAISYWNEYKHDYNVEESGKEWAPCSNLNYEISQKGSMDEYWEIFLHKDIRVWIFSGDWDDQVPFPDT